MRIRGTFAVLFTVSLVLLAGCSGDQSGNQPGGKQSGGASSQQKATPVQPKTPVKTALGTISNVEAGKDMVYLRPTLGKKIMSFRIVNGSRITVNGRKAGLADVKKGQQAKIEYHGRKNPGFVQNIEVFGGGGGPKRGGEKTGG